MVRGKQHPCWNWCAGRIEGIVENLRLRGEIDADFDVEIRSARGLTWVPAGALQMTCQHRRTYVVVPKQDGPK